MCRLSPDVTDISHHHPCILAALVVVVGALVVVAIGHDVVIVSFILRRLVRVGLEIGTHVVAELVVEVGIHVAGRDQRRVGCTTLAPSRSACCVTRSQRWSWELPS